jgi:hypothetical protein
MLHLPGAMPSHNVGTSDQWNSARLRVVRKVGPDTAFVAVLRMTSIGVPRLVAKRWNHGFSSGSREVSPRRGRLGCSPP